MILSGILRDSNYLLSQFTDENINRLEENIIVKIDKNF